MKKIIAMLMALVLSFSGAGSVWAAAVSADFVDVNPNTYYYDSIAYVNEAGLMTGRDDTHFHPDDYLQRQELAVIIGRHYINTLNSELNLSTSADYYTDSVNWVKKHHIMNGYDNGNFGVGDYITREDFIVTLYNYAQQVVGYASIPERDESVLGQFADRAKISGYAYEPMYWQVSAGVIRGYDGDGIKVLDPQGHVTRGMAAVMLERFFEYYGSDFSEYGTVFAE